MLAIILVAIGAIILSLWCSNERRILQSEHQEQNKQDIDEHDEPQHGELEALFFIAEFMD